VSSLLRAEAVGVRHHARTLDQVTVFTIGECALLSLRW
jgi:hypothetical protein